MNKNLVDSTAVHITTLTVAGVRCGGCAAHIARALDSVNGVVHVEMHDRQSEIVVEHLPAHVDAALIAATIRGLGYGADVHTTVPDLAPYEGVSSPCRCCAEPTSTAKWANLGTGTIG